jgi:hypothetical protein
MNKHADIGMEAGVRPTRTSELLRDFTQSLTAERVSIAEIVAGLGDRGLGVLIAIFALPNILPAAVPFGNVPAGIPPLIFAVQLMLGMNHLILPGVVAKRTIRTSVLRAFAPRVASVLSWFERLLTPRLFWVTGYRCERIMGAIAIVLALVAMLPIPFGHNLPALGLVLIGLGLIERDGAAILGGAAVGIAGTILLVLVVFGLAHGLSFVVTATG